VPRRDPDEPSDAGSSEPSGDTSAARSGGGAPRRLTDRQLEILVHVARGRTNPQIGRLLGISERTVRNHMRSILQKLTSTDRTQAVVIAIERGWIAIPIEPELSDSPAAPEPASPGADEET
jgi:DNA-binding NarL/FixJ family response regulator